MRSLWLGVLVCAAMFVACGDDGSDSATRPSGGSSSNLVSLATPCKTETEDNCEYGELVDGRDGQVYKTVSIGTQIWMAQNLNYETANSYCYNDNASNCIKYGRLYTWAAAMDSAGTWSANGEGCGAEKTCLERNPVRGVCPEGWHLPSKDEWETLFKAVDGKSTAGTKLKSTSGWNRNGNGTDAFSFSALPAGERYSSDGYYSNVGDYAYFWSATEWTGNFAYNMYLYYDGASWGVQVKYYGHSVRCVKDDP